MENNFNLKKFLIENKLTSESKSQSIEERIEQSGFFDFSDGYLGSTNHGAPYYDSIYGTLDYIHKIDKDENYLKSLTLDKSYYDEYVEDQIHNYDEFWNKWFSDVPEFEIIEDSLGNSNKGYGKITINQTDKIITIQVVPVLFSGDYEEKLIFGFEKDGKLVRLIPDEEIKTELEQGNYIG